MSWKLGFRDSAKKKSFFFVYVFVFFYFLILCPPLRVYKYEIM